MKRAALLLGLTALSAGCPSSNEGTTSGALAESAKPQSASSAPAPATSTSAAPTASAAVIGAAPACTIKAQKSWATGVNKTTGLTAVELPDGRVALGLAVGNTPHVLVVGRNGDGKLVKVPPKDGTQLAKKVENGHRTILRVTPVKVDDKGADAFADYKDEYKDKHKRVACGPADGQDAWILFDGVPFLDRDPQPQGAERAAFFQKKDPDGDDGYHELRDCRSFSDLKSGETWIVGSELRATEKDGKVNWRASLVIDKGPKTHETHLHELDLKGEPPKVTDFQVPMLRRLHDGSWIITARYGDSMLAALLTADKALKGNVVMYPGFSTRADVGADGDDTVVTTSIAKGKDYLLKAIRLAGKSPELPKGLTPIVTDDDDKDSESEPDFTRDSKGRRWVSYIEGERGNGHLEIVPVDEKFHATGKPFEITKEEERASEARLVEMTDGAILVAFLRESGKEVELVTEELACEVVLK